MSGHKSSHALDQVKFLIIIDAGRDRVEITRQEWQAARRRGVIVYPVKSVSDNQLDYAALPNWTEGPLLRYQPVNRRRLDEREEWQTFVNYLK